MLRNKTELIIYHILKVPRERRALRDQLETELDRRGNQVRAYYYIKYWTPSYGRLFLEKFSLI